MSPKLPPTLENFSLLTFSSIYPFLLVSCTSQPEHEMIGKWELNPDLEQTLIPGAVLEWWGAAKRMAGAQSQRNSAGHPPPVVLLGMLPAQPLEPHLLLLFNQFFWTKSLGSKLCEGAQAAFQKKHFQVESRLGILQDGSLDSSSARAVFSCCAAH